jgi:hypothetical protein
MNVSVDALLSNLHNSEQLLKDIIDQQGHYLSKVRSLSVSNAFEKIYPIIVLSITTV